MTDVPRWHRIEEAFHAVADMEAGLARDSRVLDLCGRDATLAADVDALLVEDGRLQGAEAPADPHPGLRLGSYQVDGLIARGGMAAVYEGHRADDQFRQRVAVKIMDLRLSDPALVAQFKAERQILAALEHPTLTRLLDGGVTALGEPYLVMEYVDGLPIDRYCDEHRLDLGARRRLFAEACAGVDFAHRNLILHRDLKPSNVLVTVDGHAKVVDFGTATLLQPDRLATVSRAPLTPAYASPEQLTGEAVGTASDQYSLGLVLYELLTGMPAFGEHTSLIASVERALAGTEPTAAHTTVTAAAAEARQISAARLKRQLAGDLGTIVRKALATDPVKRYASVQHLADDLARWADGEPILGRPPSLAYVTSRFVRRHWVAVSVAATLLLSLMAATALSFQQAVRARRQATIAQSESAKARSESGKVRQLNRFLTQMLSSANPSWYNANGASAGSVTVRQVLDGASQLIAAELSGTPEVEAEMQRTLGRTYIGMAEPDRAGPHLDRALALYREQRDPFGTAFTEALLGEQALLKGDYPTAETRLRASLAYVRSLGDVPTDPELHMMATNDLGVAISNLRPGHPEATALKREGIAVADRDRSSAGASVIGRANLGLDFYNIGDLDEADTLFREALRRLEALPVPLPERGFLFNNLSQLRRVQGDHAEAERFGAAAVEAAAQVWGESNIRWAAFASNWGRALVAVGQVERGRTTLIAAYDAYRPLRPAGHVDFARPLVGLGAAYRLLGQLAESERVLREAQALIRPHPSFTDRAGDIAVELGLTVKALGRRAEATAILHEAHRIYQSARGDAHPSTKQVLALISGS